MKLRYLSVLTMLCLGISSTDSEATVSTSTHYERNLTQLDNARVNLKSGDTYRGEDGQVYTYRNPYLNDLKISGKYIRFNEATQTYTYLNSTYDGQSVTNATTQITAATAQVETALLNTQISERINTAMHNVSPASPGTFAMGNGSGMNAGNKPINVGIWGMYAFSNVNDNSRFGFKSNIHSGTIGMDYLFNPCVLGGIAFTYGRINNGKYNIREGKYKHDSYTAALYGSFIVYEMVSLDAMLGYGKVHKKYNERRVAGFADDGTIKLDQGEKLSGNTTSRRLLGSLFVNVRHNIEKFNIWGRGGYTHVNEKEDSFHVARQDYKENRPGGTVNIGDLKGNARLGYAFHEMVTPYGGGGINYHIVRKKNNTDTGPSLNKDTRFGWMVEGGLNLNDQDKIVEGNVNYFFHKQGPRRSHNVSLLARYNFR